MEQIRDEIQRVIDLPIGLSRAWQAITTPEDISNWFSDRISFAPEVGADIVFDWDDHGKKYGRVEVIDPSNRFAFRWRVKGLGPEVPIEANNSTLVMMELTQTSEGTRLTVTESGFSNLPPDLQDFEFHKNESGWDYELNDLSKYFQGGNHH
jgi:uncharacterized protein YndB with AHSA1/START domain